MGIEDYPGAEPGLPGRFHQVEDIHITNRGRLVTLPVGNRISCGDQDRVDPQRPAAPE